MNQDLFTTYDLGLSAALVAAGFHLETLDRSHPSRVLFIFLRNDQVDQAVNDYWGNDMTLPPQEYFNAMKSLKNQIYSQ